jgi:hypothetical protein
MTTERKGFTYPLEPVRSLTDWNVNDLGRELAAINRTIDEQRSQLDASSAQFAAARAEVMRQRDTQLLLNVGTQRVAHNYLIEVQRQLQAHKQRLQEMMMQREELFTRLTELRKFSESLDRNRESLVEEHDRKIVKQSYEQADESWLQRLKWRKQP